jgi:hypothetical protein
MDKRRAKRNPQEEHAADQYNSNALLEAYNKVVEHDGEDVEFSAEFGSRDQFKAPNPVLESYEAGTIEQDDVNKERYNRSE